MLEVNFLLCATYECKDPIMLRLCVLGCSLRGDRILLDEEGMTMLGIFFGCLQGGDGGLFEGGKVLLISPM